MRVDQTSSLSSTSPRREAKAAGGDGRFAEALQGDVTTTAASAPKMVASVDNLFMLQEVMGDQAGNRKRALQRGNSMLDRLDDIRIGLLSGSLPRGQLENLRNMAREQLDQVDDPELEAVLKDIDLRVAVELAKLESAA
jgi:hypothetical protein